MQYGNEGVDHFRGELNVTVPVYTYKDKDFEIPVSLGYNSAGFIPSQQEGIVGLHWFLNAGGIITRKVNGFPDEKEGEPSSASFSLHGMYYGMKNNLGVTVPSREELFNLSKGTYTIGSYWSINGCEVEPDEFSFKMPGHSGRFFIQHDGSVQCVGNQNYKVDLSKFSLQVLSSIDVNPSEIVITDHNGYEYVFGGDVQYLELTHPLEPGPQNKHMLGPRCVINAWRIRRITAPNGRKVTFTYQSFMPLEVADALKDPDHYILGEHTTNTATSEVSSAFTNNLSFETRGPTNAEDVRGYEVVKTCYLSNIAFDDGTAISFIYSKRSKKFYLDATLEFVQDFNQFTQKLDGIDVSYRGVVKKRYALEYEYLGGNGTDYGDRLFLTKFTDTGLPQNGHIFTYYKTSQIPGPRTRSLDYWGFWNGGYSRTISLIPAADYYPNGDLVYRSPNEREPIGTAYDVGLLQRITYPTKGYSVFTYEPHTYSQRLERRSAAAFLPQLYPVTGRAGGARIRKIENFDDNGRVFTKEYKYINNFTQTVGTPNEVSSGILMSWPRYLNFWIFKTAQGTTTKLLKTNSSSFNVNHYPGEKYIQYAEVTELQVPTNGCTVYKYTNYLTNPDENRYGSKELVNFEQTEQNYKNSYNNYKGIKFNDKSFERGLLSAVNQYAGSNNNFTPVTSSSTEYGTQPDYQGDFSVGVHMTGGIVQSFRIYHQPYLPIGKTDVLYDQNDAAHSVTTTTDYTYNSYGQVAEIRKLTSGAGTTDVSRVRYVSDIIIASTPADDASKALALMKQRNIVSPMVEQQQWVRNGTTERLVKASLIKYRNFSVGGLQPESMLSLRVQKPVTNYVNAYVGVGGTLVHDDKFDPELNFVSYDGVGNLRQQKREDGVSTTYLWGYNRILPIAKIDNATYTEAETVLGATVIAELEGNGPTDDQMRSRLAPLRTASKFMVTTYTYDPLRGMTSQTDPAGITTYYQYDEWDRLKLIKDQDQKIVKSYFYHYKQ
jgi:YD repeat-containing protein